MFTRLLTSYSALPETFLEVDGYHSLSGGMKAARENETVKYGMYLYISSNAQMLAPKTFDLIYFAPA